MALPITKSLLSNLFSTIRYMVYSLSTDLCQCMRLSLATACSEPSQPLLRIPPQNLLPHQQTALHTRPAPAFGILEDRRTSAFCSAGFQPVPEVICSILVSHAHQGGAKLTLIEAGNGGRSSLAFTLSDRTLPTALCSGTEAVPTGWVSLRTAS